MSGTIFTTGFGELDKALAGLEPKVQRKYGRRALNNSLKIVEKEYKARVPVRSGAMRDAVVRRTPKGKRGELKRALTITQESLAKSRRKVAIKGVRGAAKAALSADLKALRADRTLSANERASRRAAIRASSRAGVETNIATAPDFADGDFYPAYVELGTSDQPGQRPMRGALYDNSERIKQEFVSQLREMVRNGGK